MPQSGSRQAAQPQAPVFARATEKELEKFKGIVERRRLSGRDPIGVRVGKVVNKYKVAEHFALDVEDHLHPFLPGIS